MRNVSTLTRPAMMSAAVFIFVIGLFAIELDLVQDGNTGEVVPVDQRGPTLRRVLNNTVNIGEHEFSGPAGGGSPTTLPGPDTDGDGVPDATDNCLTTFNPGKFTFTSKRDGLYDIFVMDVDGTDPVNLTAGGLNNMHSKISPDGKKVAFVASAGGNARDIYLMNIDGSGKTNIRPDAFDQQFPYWSPDGSKIVFESNDTGNADIFVMDSDGGNLVNLTNHPSLDSDPAYSPDGTKITFVSRRDALTSSEIYVMNADGTGVTRITDNATGEFDPVFSPDGSKIAFSSSRNSNLDIYVMNADGTGEVRLTTDPELDFDPAWSPNADKIAFVTWRDDNAEIYVMNSNGTNQVNLTNNWQDDEWPMYGGQLDSDGDGVGDACEDNNSAPAAVADAYGTNEDTPLNVPALGVLSNDTDPDGNPLSSVLVSGPSNALSFVLNANGSFSYTPATNFSGSDSFTYKANDGSLDSEAATVTITVNAVNDPPVADDDSYSVSEDEILVVPVGSGVLEGDTDVEGGSLTVTGNAAAHGNAVVNADGSFTYTPNTNFSGSDSFTYIVFDDMGFFDTGLVTITVNPVNDPPVADDDSYSVSEDGLLGVTAGGGVLAGDIDIDGDALSVTSNTPAIHGTITLNANGSFSYTPNANFSGTDSFTYTVHDGSGGVDTGSVTIIVNPANDAPVAFNNLYAVLEDTQLSISAPGVLGNDTDGENDPLTAAVVSGPPNGNVTLNADGSFVYTPNTDFRGIDSFTYKANDGSDDSNIAAVIITVIADTDGDGVPDSRDNCVSTPNPEKIAFSSFRTGNWEIYVMDADGTNETRLTTNSAYDLEPVFSPDGSKIAFRSIRDGNYEIYVMNADGSNQTRLTSNAEWDITPAFSPDGSKIAFASNRSGNYEIYLMNADGTGQTNLTNNTAGDSEPAFSPDGAKIAFRSLRSGNGDIYVMNVDGSNPTRLTNNGAADLSPEISPDGSKIVFASDRDGNREIYVMNADGTGQTRLTNNPANQIEPTFSPDGSKIAFVLIPDEYPQLYVMNADGSGLVDLSNNGEADSAPSWGRQADNDGDGIGDACDNTAPVANDDHYSTNEDVPLTITVPGVLGNDTDGENDALTAIELLDDPLGGTVVLNADGSFTYTPAPNSTGIDFFTYKANDGSLDSNEARVTITRLPVNDNPTAFDDEATVGEDSGANSINVLDNDSFAPDIGETLTVTVVGQGGHGSVAITGGGTGVSYTPAANYNGPDSFTYTIADEHGGVDTASVSITVNPVNDNPDAVNDNASVAEDSGPNAINVLGNDSILPDVGETLAVTNVTQGAHGSVAITGGGAGVSYTPAANYNGSDFFTYTISDGNGGVDTTTVSINVTSVNDNPDAFNDNATVGEDSGANAINVLGNDSILPDAGETLAVTNATQGAHGSVAITGGGAGVSYTPAANYNGSDSFTYAISDGNGGLDTATVAVTVLPVNDAPMVSATPETQPDVQYSDAIQTVTINAADLETPASGLSIAFSYTRNAGPSVTGLPAGMMQGGVGGAWTVSGTAGVSAGTYVITAMVTDSGDGTSAAVMSYDMFTIVVKRENAIAAPRMSNPVSMQVASPGGTASGTTAEICFDITEIEDDSAGDTSLITSASVQISAVGGGGSGGITASSPVFSGGGVDSAREACFTLTMSNTPANAYEVTLVIGGDHYTGSGTTAFIVFDPSAGFASGGGWIINPNTGYRANYGVNVKYLKNGNAQGSILYVEHRPDGDYKVKSTSLNSSGGFAIVPITGGAEAQISGKANYVVNDVGIGNHSFIVRMIDRGQPGTNDAFGLKLINPSGQIMNSFTFNPVLLGGGNNQVPKK